MTTTGPRPRFSIRAGLASPPEHDGPFEGVPEHLLVPLRSWVDFALDSEALDNPYSYEEDPAARTICMRLRIPPAGSAGLRETMYRAGLKRAAGHQLLDVIDAILGYKAEIESDDPDSIDMLATLLQEGGSAYRITEAMDGLEERVTPTVRDAVHQTVADSAAASSAGSAADHLATAWQAAYGRSPAPERAYSEAIKAVEAAAHATVQTNNKNATLGTMLGEIGNARHKFETAISTPPGKDPMAPVEAMMRALWQGQTSRHGGQVPTVPETLEAARAGVHLAAALVQWFVSGAVVRTP